jgi:gliding motility-associated-like protein
LIATNSAGCPDTAETVISNLPSPNIGADQQSGFCQNTVVDLTGFFNTTGLTSDWTLNSVTVANPVAVNAAGNYQLIVTDINSCSDTAMLALTSISAPSLGTNQSVNLCPGASENLNTVFNVTGLTTEWSLGGIIVPDVSAISTPGNYQLVATNSSGCTDTVIALVASVAAPTLGPNQLVSGCQGDVFNLTTLYSTGSNTVQWTFNGSAVSNPASVNQSGNYQITVTNSFGCTKSSVATIQLNAVPVLGSDHNIEFCSNENYDLTGLFNLTGLTSVWSLNGGVVNDPQSITAGGNYQLVATNSNICRDTAVVFAQMNTAPDLGADQSYMLCPWMTVDLNNTFSFNGLTPSWTVNGLPYTVTNPVHDVGLFQVNVTDANGCNDVAAVAIDTMFCECEADFVFAGKCIQEPVQFTLLADSVIVGASWSFSHPLMPQRSEINPVVKFFGDEPVNVTLVANLSCGVQTVEKTVVFEDCSQPCPVFLPAAFTPNTDGKNERFQVFTECFPLEFELEIHNRFGQLIFSSATPALGWDGKYNEVPSPEGLYVYRVGYKMPYQKKVVKTGTIALIR